MSYSRIILKKDILMQVDWKHSKEFMREIVKRTNEIVHEIEKELDNDQGRQTESQME